MYIYNDEDNAPMNDFDRDGHNPTVYASRAEMNLFDHGETEPQEEPAYGCWNCIHFDWKHEACSIDWNNLDDSYYNPETDNRELTDRCEFWREDPDADPECLKDGGNEP